MGTIKLNINWHKLLSNYIGSLGYYLFVVCLISWIYFQFMRFVSATSLLAAPVTYNTVQNVSEAEPNLLVFLLIKLIAILVVVITVVLALTIPYWIGIHCSIYARKLLKSMSVAVNAKSLQMCKQSLNVIMAIIVIVTMYNYSLPLEQNPESVFLIMLCIASMVMFFVQRVLNKLWHIKFINVF